MKVRGCWLALRTFTYIQFSVKCLLAVRSQWNGILFKFLRGMFMNKALQCITESMWHCRATWLSVDIRLYLLLPYSLNLCVMICHLLKRATFFWTIFAPWRKRMHSGYHHQEYFVVLHSLVFISWLLKSHRELTWASLVLIQTWGCVTLNITQLLSLRSSGWPLSYPFILLPSSGQLVVCAKRLSKHVKWLILNWP